MLLAKYECGSSCLGLKNSRDKDILLIYETEEECRWNKINNCDHSVDYHYSYPANQLRIRLGSYANHFIKLIEGEEIKEIKEFNFLEHVEEWKEIANKFVCFLDKQSKKWYQVLAGYYFIKNGKMKLTKTQLEKVQETHDYGISCELYEKLIEYFK